MTVEEIYTKYIGIFKVLIKAAGQETGNSSYKNVDKILSIEDNVKIIKRAIEDEVEIRLFVTILIFMVMIDIHGVDKLENTETEDMKNLITSMYQLYLHIPTRKFCTKYGLPTFNDPEMTCVIRSLKDKQSNK